MASPVEIIAPTIVRFTMKHTVANGHASDNIVDVSVDEFATTRHDGVLAIVNGVRDAWQDQMIGMMGNSVTFTGGHFLDLDSLGGISGDFSPNGAKPTVGTVTNPQTSPNTAYLVKKNTAHTRRQRGGRMYIPGVDESVTDQAGIVASGFVSAANTRLAAFKSAITAVGALFPPTTTSWRVVHIAGYDTSTDPPTPNAWNSSDVTSAICDNRVASQRRRNR